MSPLKPREALILTCTRWVFSNEQSTSQSAGHKIYTPSSSTSAILLSGETWSIKYGDGSGANGNVYTDTVTVGGSTFSTQAVEAAQNASSSFDSNTESSGLLGLAFSNLNTGIIGPHTSLFLSPTLIFGSETQLSVDILRQHQELFAITTVYSQFEEGCCW